MISRVFPFQKFLNFVIKGIFDTIYPFLNDNLLKVPRQEKCLTKLNSCKYLFTKNFIIAKNTVIIGLDCQVWQKDDFVSLVVLADTEGPCSPCGACRQVMHELLPVSADIILANMKGEFKVTNTNELLPFAFGSEDLK